MNPVSDTNSGTAPPKRSLRRRVLRGCGCGCAGMAAFLFALASVAYFMVSRVPKSYPLTAHPIAPPSNASQLGGGLAGFESPYLGHMGSWDGKGGAIFGAAKIPDMEKERAMGLRWTFMPVYWRVLEPDGPVDLSANIPPAWQALDQFFIAAKARGLNVLLQAPVVGGNAGGPPGWAGRREQGKSAPENMEALAAFAGKLAERYRPGGTLAQREKWGTSYGARAWELDNEPDCYRTNWKGQAADYAEFATLAAARIKAADPQAVILLPSLAGGKDGPLWLEGALDAAAMNGSPRFRANGKPFSIGPVADVVSFHDYEGLNSSFSDRTIVPVFDEVRAVFEKWEQRATGFAYAPKQEYWHTEGDFDFFGILSAERRAAWRFQFFTRAFAAGIRKVIVMDGAPAEHTAVRAYIETLPNPFPMLPATDEVKRVRGQISAFRHPEGLLPNAGQIWVVWALANTGDATIEIPVRNSQAQVITVAGQTNVVAAAGGQIRLDLKGDAKMAPPLLIIDRPASQGN